MPPFLQSLIGFVAVVAIYNGIDYLPKEYQQYSRSAMYLLFAGYVFYAAKGDKVWQGIAIVFACFALGRLYL